MVCISFLPSTFSRGVGRKRKDQSTLDWSVGETYASGPLRAGDGIRTRDLLLGKETYYYCTSFLLYLLGKPLIYR